MESIMPERVKEFLFTKNTYIGVRYEPAIGANNGYFRGAEVITAIGGTVTLVFVPSNEELDTINVYLTAADAYELGKLLMERAEVASQERLEVELERGIIKGKYGI